MHEGQAVMTNSVEVEVSVEDGEVRERIRPDVLAIDLRTAIMRTSRRLRTEVSGDTVSAGQYTALTHLQTGDRSLGELADLEYVQAPSMTRIVNALAAQGLVSRSAHPDDGRQILLSITPAGVAVLQDARTQRTAWLAQRVAVLSDEDRQVLSRAAHLMQEMSAR